MEYWILAGGNLGDTQTILNQACEILVPKLGNLVYRSSFYESEAWGFESSNFINQLFIIESSLNPDDFMAELLAIEASFGRVRNGNGYEARIIDLDILFAGKLVYESRYVLLPHPRMHLRKFALLPCLEYNAQYMHPKFMKTIEELSYSCEDVSSVIKL